jgi:hypothetical protein
MERKITIGNENMTFYQVSHSENVHFIWKCILCNNSKSNTEFARGTRFIWSTSNNLNSELSLDKNPDLKTPGSDCNYNDQYDSLSSDCINEISEKISIKYYVICGNCFETILGDSVSGEERLQKIEKAKTERLEAEEKRNSDNKIFREKQITEDNIIFEDPSKDNYKSFKRYLIVAENKLHSEQPEEASKILDDIERYINSLPKKSLFSSDKKIPDDYIDYIDNINTIFVIIQRLGNPELNTKINNLLKKDSRLSTKSKASFSRKSRKSSNTKTKSKSRKTSKITRRRKSRNTSKITRRRKSRKSSNRNTSKTSKTSKRKSKRKSKKTSKPKSKKTPKPKSRRTCRRKSK